MRSLVPHLLTTDQKKQRIYCSRKLLKQFKNCGDRVISNLDLDLSQGMRFGSICLSHRQGQAMGSGEVKKPETSGHSQTTEKC